jgi:hypothetical protein
MTIYCIARMVLLQVCSWDNDREFNGLLLIALIEWENPS